MQVSIRQKNLEVTPTLASYVETKIVKNVARLLRKEEKNGESVAEFEMERTTRHHRKGLVYKVRADVSSGGKNWHAEAEGEDIRAACGLLKEELEREIKKSWGRSEALDRRHARALKKEIQISPVARILKKKGSRVRDESN